MWTNNNGDTTWLLVCACLVLLMTPGLAILYGGSNINRGNVMHAIMSSLVAFPVVSIQWFIWGYSLACSPNGGKFIGDVHWAAFHGHMNDMNGYPNELATTPNMAYCFFQMMFAIITPAIVFSGAVERLKMGWFMLFLFVWSTVVYDIISYWTWAPNGWYKTMGGLDTAGGLVVEINSGFASLAMAFALGPRKQKAKEPVSPVMIVIGGSLIWFGWIGFNAGSVGTADAKAANAAMVTHLSACFGAAAWMVCDYIKRRKLSPIALINGALAGLVAITPAAAYVEPTTTIAFGIFTAVICYLVCNLRKKFADDALDAFVIHGVAGFIGTILTGIFADNRIMALDGSALAKGGWINHHYMQILYQLAGSCAAAGWSFVVTFIIVKAMQLAAKLMGTSIVHEEQDDLDNKECGECAHSFLEPNKAFVESSTPNVSREVVVKEPHTIHHMDLQLAVDTTVQAMK